jgi:hypothetical protein
MQPVLCLSLGLLSVQLSFVTHALQDPPLSIANSQPTLLEWTPSSHLLKTHMENIAS